MEPAKNCAVFWAPSARPAHQGPPISATEVNANPFGATVTMVAATIVATATGPGSRSLNASRPIATATATATRRRGRNRLPTRSDHTPTPRRPSAPNTCAAATSRAADISDQPCSLTSQTSAKVSR